MGTTYIVVGIICLLLIILVSVKYVIADKYTLREMLNAKNMETITKSELPSKRGSSQNFTYSIWFYVNNWNYNYGVYKPIFGKFEGLSGTDYNEYIKDLQGCSKSYKKHFEDYNTNKVDAEKKGCDTLKPKPVVTFDTIQNDILIFIPCDKNLSQTESNIFQCTVKNIPIQKWVNLSITLYKKTLDIYINGKLHKTCVLPNIPDMLDADGEGNVHITPGGGFDGYTSKFQFYPEALNPQEIWNIYSNGYGSLASSLGDYQIKMSLIENGNETNSFTI